MNTSETPQNVHEQIVTLLPRLRRFERNLTRNPHDADDVVQIAVERALTRSDQWQSGARLDSWVFKIVRNAWIDELFIRPGSGGWRNRSRNLRHGNGMQRLNPAMTAAVVALSPQRLTTYDLPRCCEPAALLTTSTC